MTLKSFKDVWLNNEDMELFWKVTYSLFCFPSSCWTAMSFCNLPTFPSRSFEVSFPYEATSKKEWATSKSCVVRLAQVVWDSLWASLATRVIFSGDASKQNSSIHIWTSRSFYRGCGFNDGIVASKNGGSQKKPFWLISFQRRNYHRVPGGIGIGPTARFVHENLPVLTKQGLHGNAPQSLLLLAPEKSQLLCVDHSFSLISWLFNITSWPTPRQR